MTQEQIKKKLKEISNIVEKSLQDTFLGEPLDQKTRDKIVKECVNPYINTNLYDIICDETNNTPEDIFNRKIVFDIKAKLDTSP